MTRQHTDRGFTCNDDHLAQHDRAKVVASPKVLDARPVNTAESSPAPVSECLTVAAWGEQWLQRREREGLRIAKDDRRIWRTHVAGESWARLPLTSITRSIARAWWTGLHAKGSSNPTHRVERRSRLLQAATLANVRQCVRKCFEDAADEGLVGSNPFAGLKVARSRRARTRDAFTVLYREEQARALSLFASTPEWYLVVIALYTGIRQGEQWALRLADVELSEPPSIVVRFGAFGEPTKGGRPRRVFLFGLALVAMREWIERVLPGYAPSNPHQLVFPKRSGEPRAKGRAFRGFARISLMIGRSFSWHGLRHSCATSLVGGWWGSTWTLEEVRRHLGHSSVQVTERYAHFVDDTLRRAVARMPQLRGVSMKNGRTVDVGEAERVEGCGDRRLSSEVEQRFRNTESVGQRVAAGQSGPSRGEPDDDDDDDDGRAVVRDLLVGDRVCLAAQAVKRRVLCLGTVRRTYREGAVLRAEVVWDGGGLHDSPVGCFFRVPREGGRALVLASSSPWFGTICEVADVYASPVQSSPVLRLRHPSGGVQAFRLDEVEPYEWGRNEARDLNADREAVEGPRFDGAAQVEIEALRAALRVAASHADTKGAAIGFASARECDAAAALLSVAEAYEPGGESLDLRRAALAYGFAVAQQRYDDEQTRKGTGDDQGERDVRRVREDSRQRGVSCGRDGLENRTRGQSSPKAADLSGLGPVSGLPAGGVGESPRATAVGTRGVTASERETAREIADEDIAPNADDMRRAWLAIPGCAESPSSGVDASVLRARVAHELADLRATLDAEHRKRGVLLRTAIGHLNDVERATLPISAFLDVANVLGRREPFLDVANRETET